MVTLRRPLQTRRNGPTLRPHQIVLRPLITEKATFLAEARNTYAFEVHGMATKLEIKAAVEELFEVQVEKVRTMNRRGKARRFRLVKGRTKDMKRALVTLKSDYRIDFF